MNDTQTQRLIEQVANVATELEKIRVILEEQNERQKASGNAQGRRL